MFDYSINRKWGFDYQTNAPSRGFNFKKGSRDASTQSSLAITTREMFYITTHAHDSRKCHASKPLIFSDFTLSSTASSLNFATMFTEKPRLSNNLPQVPFSCVNTMDVPTASCWNILKNTCRCCSFVRMPIVDVDGQGGNSSTLVFQFSNPPLFSCHPEQQKHLASTAL